MGGTDGEAPSFASLCTSRVARATNFDLLLKMNSSETQPHLALASSTSTDSADFSRIRIFTSRYYRVLGWVDLVSSVISLAIAYWTGHLAITFGFALWFWLANGLKQGRPSARNWAIKSTALMVALLVIGMCFPEMKLRLAPWGIGRDNPAFLFLVGIVVAVLTVPVMVLLGESGRRAFREHEGEQAASDNER